MKKLSLLFMAVFAICATSFAQVEAPTETTIETPTRKAHAPSVKMKNKRAKAVNKSERKRVAMDKRSGMTPAQRTEKIVDRINTQLVDKDPSLALTEDQKTQMIDLHAKRQLTQKNRPKLETEEDKIAYKKARRAATKEFKESINAILTPAQSAVYAAQKGGKKGVRPAAAKNKVKRAKQSRTRVNGNTLKQ